MTTKQKLLSTLTALGMMAGIASAAPASIGWSFFEVDDTDYTLGQSQTLQAGIDNKAYWNDLNAPSGSVGAPTPDPAWTEFLDSAGTSVSGTAQITATSADNFTGVTKWAGIDNSTTGHDKMMGAGAMNFHNNAAASFTISVQGLAEAYRDHTDGFVVRVYWGGISGSSGTDTVETVYTIGTSSGSLTYNGSVSTNWEDRDNSAYILNGNYVILELATLNTNHGFDLVVSRGDENRRIGISGFEIVAIPEPGTLALVGIALGSLLLFRRKK